MGVFSQFKHKPVRRESLSILEDDQPFTNISIYPVTESPEICEHGSLFFQCCVPSCPFYHGIEDSSEAEDDSQILTHYDPDGGQEIVYYYNPSMEDLVVPYV